MRNTLLLVFIHGFKGGEDTFGNFPEQLRTLVSKALPAIQVVTVVYPRYETKGDLKETVGRFREWLQNTVIDLEVANQTASPTVDPSVHVFLVGHSMGGIVGAEALLLLAAEQPIPPNFAPGTSGAQPDGDSPVVEPGTFMFPHVQGVLAFDTPFLGIAPGVMAYGAEEHYRNATTAYNAFSDVAGIFGIGKNDKAGATQPPQEPPKALPASSDAAATPPWQRWGRYAMFAGAAGAVAAGGAAMYSQRQRLTEGLTWVSSHLEFVGCLTKTSDLRQRVEGLSKVQEERGIGCVNFYTCLGKGATSLLESTGISQTSFSQKIIRSKNRTFCSLPSHVEGDEEAEGVEQLGLRWTKAVNDQASDEVKAHITMFLPKENPAFPALVVEACKTLVKSIDKGWYSTSTGPVEAESDAQRAHAPPKPEDDFMDGDDVVVVD
ncbi:uncharacterized protein PFLUO_LOCUS5384 [Penicillium psychrofluorescens]|uniref:uncharacterized protein n=1 Tax=Penicillium psychrofluorescens TaxID=3158075 RepID=UPI003CCD2F7C